MATPANSRPTTTSSAAIPAARWWMRKGEIVGLAFDGNIHSISGSYWFDGA